MEVEETLKKFADPVRAKLLQRYFKTGKGEYAEGDIFLGLTLPQVRSTAKLYAKLEPAQIQKLIDSPYHEFRLTGLLILVGRYQKGTPAVKRTAVQMYLRNTKRINNWDLVDVTAPRIIGDYYENRPKDKLKKMARSRNLWDRRIAILSTFPLIRKGDFADSLEIYVSVLADKHDLIHKALGWMLREVGKKDGKVLEDFLVKHIRQLPRTSLRYAIERMDPKRRKYFMAL